MLNNLQINMCQPYPNQTYFPDQNEDHFFAKINCKTSDGGIDEQSFLFWFFGMRYWSMNESEKIIAQKNVFHI